MSKTVWKFPLPIDDDSTVKMPVGAEVLHVGKQQSGGGEELYIWALVDPGAELETRHFHLVGTGNPAPHVAVSRYLGTVEQDLGRFTTFVWHVFDAGVSS